MMRSLIGCVVVTLALAVGTLTAQVTAGTVREVTSRWLVSPFGDARIVSDVLIETASGEQIAVEVEGGTIDGLTMVVSDAHVPEKGRPVWVDSRGHRRHLIDVDDYATYSAWPGAEMTWILDTLYAEMSAAQAERDVALAAAAWHLQTAVAFEMRYGGRIPDGSGVQAYDQRNTALFRPTTNPQNAAALASTYASTVNGVLVDADVIIWTGKINPAASDELCGTATNTNVDLLSIATHEFGHVAGLSHSAISTATMYPSYLYCSLEPRSLDLDDIAAARFLYGDITEPPPPTPEEVCGDGIDNDGDGLVDEDCGPNTCKRRGRWAC